MGLDLHCLNLLRFGANQGVDYSRVLTLGRPGLFLSEDELAGFLRETRRTWTAQDMARVRGDGFSEQFLKAVFGAQDVVSLDASPYENPTRIHDMNRPLTGGGRFSAVLDFGCLEHIFNFPVAVSNVIASCREGGHLLHALPANNCCGHGFYQFSPEMFFSVYSEARGFRGTQVFLVELDRPWKWYKVRSPLESGKRVNVVNREQTYALVLTQKMAQAKSPIEDAPQQSDYLVEWNRASQPSAAVSGPSRWRKISRSLGLSSLAKAVRLPLRSFRSRVLGHRQRLRADRPDMTEIDVRSLMS